MNLDSKDHTMKITFNSYRTIKITLPEKVVW
jgi:hypothetical protein